MSKEAADRAFKAAMAKMSQGFQPHITKVSEAVQDEQRVHRTMDPTAYLHRDPAMASGMRARAVMRAYSNPLTSLISLALLSHHKQASAAAFQLALEAEAALHEELA